MSRTRNEETTTVAPENPPTTETEVEQDSQQEAEAAEVQDAGPEPNMIFIGKGEPPTSMNIGMLPKIKLPKVEEQITSRVINEETGETETKAVPFYHEHAALIIGTFSSLYKRFKPKG